MFITDLFNLRRPCLHEKITPDMESGYCPDCGKLIKNEWYITRCACCGVKLKTMSNKGDVVPQYHYCKNCGSGEFVVEKLPKINFIDINFAVLIKKEVDVADKKSYTSTCCWEERKPELPKLPVKFL